MAVNLAAYAGPRRKRALRPREGLVYGAVRQQIGKFELPPAARCFRRDWGPALDLQAKLLRAIQEDEIERIGSRARSDRLPARGGHHVDLEKAVSGGPASARICTFRLKVIPVRLPPLGERIDASPPGRLLPSCYNTKFRKQIEGISDKALRALTAYHGRATSGSWRT